MTVDEQAGDRTHSVHDRSPSTSTDEEAVDAHALIAAAIERIAREIPPVTIVPSAGERTAEPSQEEPAVRPMPGDAPASASERAVAGPSPLAYVPHGDDRMLPGRLATVQRRIEPTLDPPPEVPDGLRLGHTHVANAVAAEQGSPDATDSWVEKRASEPKAGLLSGPWTWRRALRWAGLAVAAYFATVLFLILVYRFVNPPITTLIAYQWLTGTKIQQDWVPIENISPNLLRAVVVSEDWGFCDHYGVDIDAIEKALEQAGEGKIARGASTISMQVIKNLFLSQSKSYLRKAVEIPLTVVAETVWPKSRMLEIYLNIAEWGPGIFGAESAARHHFNKPASRLTEREAALLAAALPNPILRDAGDPSTRTARKASVIQARMRAAGPEVADCAMTGRQRPATRSQGEAPRPPGWQTTVKKRAGADQAL